MSTPYFHFPEDIVTQVVKDWPLVVDHESVHGPEHWQRVSRNGQFLLSCSIEDASPEKADLLRPYVKAFALFHDCQRTCEGEDTVHGDNASRYVARRWLDEVYHYLPNRILVAALHTAMCVHTTLYPRGAKFELDGAQYPDEFQKLESWLYDSDEGLLVRICLDADRLDLGRVGKTPDASYLFTHAGRLCATFPDAFDEMEAFEPV